MAKKDYLGRLMHRVKYQIKHHWTHYVGLASSALCFVHCMAMPLVIPFLPALRSYIDHGWEFEAIFIALMSLTTITLINGYRLHQSRPTLVWASVGFALLILSLFIHNNTLMITTSGIGSLCMLVAHYTNYKLCRQQTCCPHPH